MTGKRAVGVISFCVRFQTDALDAVFFLKGSHPFGRFLLDLSRCCHIPRPLPRGLFVDLLSVDSQDLRKAVCDQLLVLSIHLDLDRAEIYVVHRCTDGKRNTAAVADRASLVRRSRFAQLLRHGERLIFFMLGDLKLIETRDQHRKRGNAARCHQKQRAAQHSDPRCPFPVVCFH